MDNQHTHGAIGEPGRGRPAPKPAAYPAAFEAVFWGEYPKGHGNKKQAAEQWRRIDPDPATLAAIASGLAAWKASGRWRRGFVKSAELWLRDRWWENDPPADAAPEHDHASGRHRRLVTAG